MKRVIYIIIAIFIIVGIIKIISISTNTNLINSKNVYEVYANRLNKKGSYDNPIIPEGFKKIETEDASWKIENGIPKGWNDRISYRRCIRKSICMGSM